MASIMILYCNSIKITFLNKTFYGKFLSEKNHITLNKGSIKLIVLFSIAGDISCN